MNTYGAVLHLHVTCVVLSGAGFFWRGLLMLKIVPHVNDTLLLAAAVTLTILIGQYPFVDAWLTAKVFGLIGYIIFGALALKHAKTRAIRIVCWLLSLAIFAFIVSVALTHDPCGMAVAICNGFR